MGARTSYQQQMWLDIDGESVTLRISARQRKSMRLSVNEQGEVDLRIPLGCTKQEVLTFVKSHEHWLKQQRMSALERQQQALHSFTVLGEEYALKTSALDEFLVAEQQIWVPGGWSSSQIRDAINVWLRPRARCYFQQQIDHWWPFFSRFGKPQPILRVKKMRTRWGSLSQRGYINLNLALMQLSPELIELVVVHELCHLKHFNHGAGFKALMTQALPDWPLREKTLQQVSRYIM